MSNRTQPFDKVLNLALRLSPIDKIRLLERVASTLEQELTHHDAESELTADFRAAWHEAMTDQTLSIDELWDGIDDE